ncbi:MAG TPA: DUF72 domain-containing protein [Anaerolineaceae bacterium]|nr:DUF72 domain-containing protein [Anaerolineaceae bacterium]
MKTAVRWREQAPEGFIYTLKALQLITHEPYSPTYQRSGLDIPRNQWDRYGSFRPTVEVFKAWDRTLEIADALDAPAIVFQCPAQFTPTRTHVSHMRAFFTRARRNDRLFAWEPRGDWPDDLIGELCKELNLIHCVDPFLHRPVHGAIRYYRVHGGADYSHKFSDDELDQLANWASYPGDVYCLFNNVHMWDDALRFKERLPLGTGSAPIS